MDTADAIQPLEIFGHTCTQIIDSMRVDSNIKVSLLQMLLQDACAAVISHTFDAFDSKSYEAEVSTGSSSVAQGTEGVSAMPRRSRAEKSKATVSLDSLLIANSEAIEVFLMMRSNRRYQF